MPTCRQSVDDDEPAPAWREAAIENARWFAAHHQRMLILMAVLASIALFVGILSVTLFTWMSTLTASVTTALALLWATEHRAKRNRELETLRRMGAL